MYQYHNYAYSSGVPGGQNVAAYSTRQSAAAAAAAAAASHNLSTSTILAADGARPRRTDEAAAAERDVDVAMMLASPSCRHPTPGGASAYLARSPTDVPPAPTDRLTAGAGARPAPYRPNRPPASVRVPGGALYSTPLDRVAVRVDADEDDAEQQQHARSHSAPAATPRRPLTADHRRGPTSPVTWYTQSTTPSGSRTDVERRLLPSPPPPPSASTPTPHDSTSNVRYRRTFPLSDVELNGPVADACEADARRPNSVSLPAASGCTASSDPASTRRRLRAARGRLNYVYTACDCGLGSTLAAMAIVAGIALVLSAVGVQLLLRLTAATTHDDAATETTQVDDSLLPAATSRSGGAITRTVVGEVAVALAAVTVALDLCCLVTVSMQCFFAVKLAHCRNGDLRVAGYLEKCSVSRMTASAGLFLSIPIFLLALMLDAVLEYTFTSAITCVVVFTAGIVSVTIIAAHSIHCWNAEKRNANGCSSESTKSPSLVLPRDVGKQNVDSHDSAVMQLKLSTLV